MIPRRRFEGRGGGFTLAGPTVSDRREQILDIVGLVVGRSHVATALAYGNPALTRDIDLWIEDEQDVALGLANALRAELGHQIEVDVSGPWAARGDAEWLAAARWTAQKGQALVGSAVAAPDGMTQQRCVEAYQHRCATGALGTLDYAVWLQSTDPRSSEHLATQGVRMWMRSRTRCADQWRAVSRLSDSEVRSHARRLVDVDPAASALGIGAAIVQLPGAGP